MAQNRVFTQEELDYLSIPPHIHLVDSMKAGDKDDARHWIDVIFPLYVGAFDLRIRWDKRLTDMIYEELGGDALYNVWKYRGFTEEEIIPMKITQQDIDAVLEKIDNDDIGYTDFFKKLVNKNNGTF